MDDILGESWVFQEIIKQGLEKGDKQRLGKDILRIVELRFPTLLAQAKQAMEQQTSVEQLETMFDKLCLVKTVEEAEAVLHAYEKEH